MSAPAVATVVDSEGAGVEAEEGGATLASTSRTREAVHVAMGAATPMMQAVAAVAVAAVAAAAAAAELTLASTSRIRETVRVVMDAATPMTQTAAGTTTSGTLNGCGVPRPVATGDTMAVDRHTTTHL